jgi:hypothetical protein
MKIMIILMLYIVRGLRAAIILSTLNDNENKVHFQISFVLASNLRDHCLPAYICMLFICINKRIFTMMYFNILRFFPFHYTFITWIPRSQIIHNALGIKPSKLQVQMYVRILILFNSL